MMKIKFLIMLSIISLASSCATTRLLGWDDEKKGESGLSEIEQAQLVSDGKRYWKRRHEKEQLKKSIAKFEELAKANIEHFEARVFLCRGYYLLADAHTEDMKEKLRLWNMGTTWGEKALYTNSSFRKRIEEEKVSFEDALGVLTRRQVDAIYWTAVNLGKWAKNDGMATILKYKGRVKKMIERVAELDPKYYYGAVHRYWGVYYAVAPFFAGGSMEKSLEQFKKAFQMENNYLGSHVLFAEHYAPRKGDKALFRKELQYVINAKESSIPDIAPEQIMEKRKAERMLKNMEEYF